MGVDLKVPWGIFFRIASGLYEPQSKFLKGGLYWGLDRGVFVGLLTSLDNGPCGAIWGQLMVIQVRPYFRPAQSPTPRYDPRDLHAVRCEAPDSSSSRA